MTTESCDYSHTIECDLVVSRRQHPTFADFCGKCLMAKLLVEISRLRVTGIQP